MDGEPQEVCWKIPLSQVSSYISLTSSATETVVGLPRGCICWNLCHQAEQSDDSWCLFPSTEKSDVRIGMHELLPFKEAQSKLPLGSVCSESLIPGDSAAHWKESTQRLEIQSNLVLSFPCCLAKPFCVCGPVGGKTFPEIQ